MSFYTVKTTEEALKDSNFEFIDKSGIYDVTIKFVSVKTNEHNARTLNFNVDYKGSEQVLYGLRLDNNNLSENFQSAIFNKLCIIADLVSIDAPMEQTHILGKERTPTTLQVLDQFSDLPVKIRVQFVYSKYNGEIRENREIRAFYRADDGATAREIINNTEIGVQYQKDLLLADKPAYRNNLTEADVIAWKAQNSKGTETTTAPTTTTTQPTANPFA